MSDGYAGPVTVVAGDVTVRAEARLAGHVEPVDGRFHWGGRLAPSAELAGLVRAGTPAVVLRVADGPPCDARLEEVDPWGGVRVAAVGSPPWTVGESGVMDEAAEDRRHIDIAVIGAGFAGLGAAIRLLRAGHRDLLVFEAASDVGGTWRDNSYPGCRCDVPSHLYSFSFAGNPEWTENFSGQAEISRYLEDCADRFGVRSRLRLRHEVTGADWDGAAGVWRLSTNQGPYTARVLIAGTGPLSEPALPDIPGLASFAGTTFHSARWRHDRDLTGRRVAVIGTGASAIQFVPEIQPSVAHLTVFQRTPPWIMPRRSRRISAAERALYRTVPGAQRAVRASLYCGRELFGVGFLYPAVMRYAQRVARRHLARQVSDPALRARLTPRYRLGCKRVLLSNDYLPALGKSNVDVVTDPIVAVRPDGVVTADGAVHEVDTIIFGTGFHVTDPSIAARIRGRDGRTLADAWQPTMTAYRGTTIHGFPNLFMLLGPNTGLGHTSVVLMIESQLRLVLGALGYMRRRGIAAIEPTGDAQRRDAQEVDRKMTGTVWITGGCRSWYLDATGRNSTLWPGFATTFRWRLRRFAPADHRTVHPTPAPSPVGG
jgi:cation diffusion facilitator CzcD-associated flavoprotein CzcO